MKEILSDSADFRQGEPIFQSREDIFDREKIEQAVFEGVKKARAIAPQIFEHLPRDKQIFLIEVANKEQSSLLDIVAEWFIQNKLVREIADQFGCQKRSEINTIEDSTAFIAVTETGSILVGSQLDPIKSEHTVSYIRIPSRRASWEDRETTWRGFAMPMALGRNFNISFDGLIRGSSCLEYLAAIPAKNPDDTLTIQTAIRFGINASTQRE